MEIKKTFSKENSLNQIYQILKTPQLTDKAVKLAKGNQYVFKVFKKANKDQIKKAIEKIYNVKVISVKILNLPPKRRRLRGIFGWKEGFKKAIVKIKEGQKIEILPR